MAQRVLEPGKRQQQPWTDSTIHIALLSMQPESTGDGASDGAGADATVGVGSAIKGASIGGSFPTDVLGLEGDTHGNTPVDPKANYFKGFSGGGAGLVFCLSWLF
jgi:hypothetical protein